MQDNILLIEDEEALRMTLGDRLRNEGYRVDFAADGNEDFEKATQRIYRANATPSLVRVSVLPPERGE